MAQLDPIKEPYASVTVATFEPIFVEWLSGLGLSVLRSNIIARAIVARPTDQLGPAGGALAPTLARFRFIRPTPAAVTASVAIPVGGIARASVATTSPVILAGPALRRATTPQDDERRRIGVDHLLTRPNLTLRELVEGLGALHVPHVLGPKLEKVLAPLGIMHLYRQLYFDAGAALGPIEQALAVAPGEVLEVVLETTRRQTAERIEQFGSEETQENQRESTSTDELSDQVQSSVTRDFGASVSAEGGMSIGVVSGGASVEANMDMSTEQSRTAIRNHLRGVTRRSSETIRKTYALSVRNVTEIGQRSMTRRVLRNESAAPVNYALRRVLRKVRIKVQSLGPRLVWQLYVSRPGEGLAQGRLVMFREADPVAPPDLPPNAPPRPQGGVDTGTQTVAVMTAPEPDQIRLSIPKLSDQKVTALVVDAIVDADPEGKDPSAPALIGTPPTAHDVGAYTEYTFSIARGSASKVTVTYSIHWEPSDAVLDQWQAQVSAARAAFEASQLEEQFQRAKALITAKSRVRSRPAADLRTEERYEILNRMISEAFQAHPNDGFPGPVEIELFHRYFDVQALFYYAHPSWWRPRHRVARQSYELSDESEPAPLGKSLGWLIQLDGDRRRNEFLNSPWLRVCLPVKSGMEQEAAHWLADHIEGRRGFDLGTGKPLARLLDDLAARRSAELGARPGPDYVTLDGEPAPSEASAAAAYPVIDEFDVTMPTDGFVYQKLDV